MLFEGRCARSSGKMYDAAYATCLATAVQLNPAVEPGAAGPARLRAVVRPERVQAREQERLQRARRARVHKAQRGLLEAGPRARRAAPQPRGRLVLAGCEARLRLADAHLVALRLARAPRPPAVRVG